LKISFPVLDPELAYLGSSLFLPKKHVEERPVRTALTFGIDEEGADRVLVRDHLHHLEVPRMFLRREQMKELELKVVDLRPTQFPSISLRPKKGFAFRGKQVAAWTALDKASGGVLVMACGSGKTILALYKIASLGVPTLIVSHQKAHLENWAGELEKHFELKGTIGWVHGDSMEYDRDIVFATVQTLASRVRNGGLPPQFYRRFGLVIFDEVHHLAAEFFCLAADIVPGQRFGLTATAKRNDRCEGIVYTHLGDIFYEDLEQEMDPIFYIVKTGIELDDEGMKESCDKFGELHMGKLRIWLGRNKKRNEVIQNVVDWCLPKKRKVYGLTHSPEHAELLQQKNQGSGVITGGTKDKDRLPILHGHDLVFATMGIGTEAYNRDDLDTLLLMTPFAANDYAAIQFQQSVGRIQRTLPGKEDALVFLFIDENIQEAAGLMWSLVKQAEKRGYEVRQWDRKTSSRKPKGW
jgi:superfamily II DNA or RNA helicase